MDVSAVHGGRIKDVLLNGRIQTAGETSVGVAVGYATGIAHPDYFFLFIIILFGILYHFIGFTWNNIFDLKYDRKDPHKSDLPLVSGRLDVSHVTLATIVLTMLTLYAFYILSSYSIDPMLSFSLILLAVLFGFLYDVLNKKTNWGQAGILVAFPSLVIFAYSFNHPVNIIFALLFIYAMLQIAFLNLITGQLKDIGNLGQANFLRSLRSRIWGSTLRISRGTKVFSVSLKAITIIVALVSVLIAFTSIGLLIRSIAIIPFAAITLFLVLRMLRTDEATNDLYRKNQVIGALIEVAGVIMFITAFVANVYLVVAFVIYPLLWVVAFNHLFFGTKMAMLV